MPDSLLMQCIAVKRTHSKNCMEQDNAKRRMLGQTGHLALCEQQLRAPGTRDLLLHGRPALQRICQHCMIAR